MVTASSTSEDGPWTKNDLSTVRAIQNLLALAYHTPISLFLVSIWLPFMANDCSSNEWVEMSSSGLSLLTSASSTNQINQIWPSDLI
jgi:hypothetical protein